MSEMEVSSIVSSSSSNELRPLDHFLKSWSQFSQFGLGSIEEKAGGIGAYDEQPNGLLRVHSCAGAVDTSV